MSSRGGWIGRLALIWLALVGQHAEAAWGARKHSHSLKQNSVKEHAQAAKSDFAELRKENRRLQFSDDDLAELNMQYDFGNCSENVFKKGYIDVMTIMYNCADEIPSPLNPPSYFAHLDGTYSPMKVYVQFNLVSLLEVSDIQGTVTVSFFLRLLWADPRIIIGAWPYLHPNVSTDGIELVDYVRNDDNPLSVWLPDVFFIDSLDTEVTDETIKLYPDGVLYWSRHFVGEFSQDGMTFHDYPSDTQRFAFTLQSFGYSADFVVMDFLQGEGLRLTALQENEVWSYQSTDSRMGMINVQAVSGSEQFYSTAFLTATFSRQSRGITYRLALPVMIFLVVVGASFWAAEDQRIDITLQVLLLASTLYIVIGQSIPFVGYLTVMDNYIITVFCLLAVTVSIHFLIETLSRKSGKYPMFGFFSYAMVLFFRIAWIPMSVAMFTRYFHDDLGIMLAFVALFATTSIFYCRDKLGSASERLQQSVLKLRMKEDLVNMQATDDSGQRVCLSKVERGVLYFSGTWYQDPIYKQLLFSSDLELLDESAAGGDGEADVAEEGQEKELRKGMDNKGEWDDAAPRSPRMQRGFSRVSSWGDRASAGGSSPAKKGRADMNGLLKSLERHQSVQLQGAQPRVSASRTVASNDVESTSVLGSTALRDGETAHSLEVKAALREFKLSTLSEMGIMLNAPLYKSTPGK